MPLHPSFRFPTDSGQPNTSTTARETSFLGLPALLSRALGSARLRPSSPKRGEVFTPRGPGPCVTAARSNASIRENAGKECLSSFAVVRHRVYARILTVRVRCHNKAKIKQGKNEHISPQIFALRITFFSC
ncbi:hypothetical protein TcCL_ESM06442 [Trypanosoma cruzi]|nr:hypothetical protein TcCL_ESM06442 [Trypanosoma cruzi]